MKPLMHAERSVVKYGGTVEDYLPIHNFLDSTKGALGDVRHRAILHNSLGPFICEKIFGTYIEVQYDENRQWLEFGKKISVRDVAEDHIVEDCGFIPSLQDWLSELPVKDWMAGKGMNERIVDAPKTVQFSPGVNVTEFDDGSQVVPQLWPNPPVSNPEVQVTFTENEGTKEKFFEQQQTTLNKLEEYKKMKQELSDSAKQVLVDAAKEFFDVVPIATSIQWNQYTPYFNDGDACIFRVNDPYVITNVKDEDDNLVDEDQDNCGDGEETWFNNITGIGWYKEHIDPNNPDCYWKKCYEKAVAEANEKIGEDAPKYIEAWNKFRNVFDSMDKDFMLDAFDDHVLVKLTREGAEVEEYSHD